MSAKRWQRPTGDGPRAEGSDWRCLTVDRQPSTVNRTSTRSRERGSALIAAIFLIVIVAVLGTFAVRLSVSQQETVNLAILGDRALAAANSGIEYGAYRAINTPANCSTDPLNPTVRTLNLTQAGLRGFAVTVNCAQTAHTEAGATIHLFMVDAFAQYGTFGLPDYTSRRVTARFTDAL